MKDDVTDIGTISAVYQTVRPRAKATEFRFVSFRFFLQAF
jgi:hypothetical protein